MERIVALVEGHTEAHFMHASYGNVIVLRAIPNNDELELSVIAEAIVEALEGIGGAIKKVVILFDREERGQTSAQIAAEVRRLIEPHCGGRTIYIGVSDREVENWILSDELHMRFRFDNQEYCYPGDGCGGKVVLKKLNRGIDASYREKAEMLKESSPAAGCALSTSLKHFISQVDFEWGWAEG